MKENFWWDKANDVAFLAFEFAIAEKSFMLFFTVCYILMNSSTFCSYYGDFL